MDVLSYNDLLMWLAIVALVVLTVRLAMIVDRILINRAHRRALAELSKAASLSEQALRLNTRKEMAPATSADEAPEHLQGF